MTLLIVTIALCLIFDFINGFHDAANAIATIVSTKVLTPGQAVVWAASFNFAAYFIFTEHAVANTVAQTVKTGHNASGDLYITMTVIIAGVVAAITWNLITWWYGIPSSSSHTLIGGFAGAAIAHAGFGAINSGPILKIAAFIFIAPLLGMFAGFIMSLFFRNAFRKTIAPKIVSLVVITGAVFFLYYMLETDPALLEDKSSYYLINLIFTSSNLKWIIISFLIFSVGVFSLFLSMLNYARSERWFKRMQLVSSAGFNMGHAGNDAQKVMGIIMVAFIIYDPEIYSLDNMIWWVPLVCYSAIALGVLSGSRKIIKTMGTKITKITPFEGVSADTAGAVTLFFTEFLGIPVSTTHTVSGSIMGVGATRRLSAVRWGVTLELLWAWILTIPVSAVIAMAFYWALRLAGLE